MAYPLKKGLKQSGDSRNYSGPVRVIVKNGEPVNETFEVIELWDRNKWKPFVEVVIDPPPWNMV